MVKKFDIKGMVINMKNKIIKFADVPPTPFSGEMLSDYKSLGFNVYLLTEDYVKFTENGNITEKYKNAIKNISDKGIDVWIRNMYNDADYFENGKPKTGSNYGDDYELPVRNITAEFSEFPSVSGFYMADEAYMYSLPQKLPISWMNKDAYQFSSFDKLKKLVDWKNLYYPDAFWHMNHVPSTSWDHYLPQNGKIYDYYDFLSNYAKNILKNIKSGGRSLCLDNYPLVGENYIEYDYLFDLLTAAKVTKEYNDSVTDSQKATFGICIQSFKCKAINDDRTRDIVSFKEITFQIFVGLSLGAKLFEYFLYCTVGNMWGILDSNGNKRLYDTVLEANNYTTVYEQAIVNYEFSSAFVTLGNEQSENTRGFIKAKNLLGFNKNINVSSSCDTLITELENNGKKGFMLVNYSDPIRNRADEITLSVNVDLGLEKMIVNGKKISIFDNIIKFTLEPGSAAFIY